MRRTLESGVPQLDLVLGGGIPIGDVLLVVGAPGSGKTTLVSQVAFHRARLGQRVLFVSTLSEPASRLIKHLRTLSFLDEAALGRTVVFESIFPIARDGIALLLDALVESVRAHAASLLVMDGFASLRDLHPDSRELRMFINQLAVAMASLDCTTVVTSSDVPDMRRASSPPEFTMSDSIVELSQSPPGERLRRTLRAWKVRGAEPLLGPHPFRITGQGVAVFPRFGTHRLPAAKELPESRVSWGIPELDVLMAGGSPHGSSTLVAGAAGTGKTLLALQYLLEGVRRGEVGLLVSLRESAAQLVRKARALKLDLETPLASGRLVILHRMPVDLELDELLHEIWTEVERTGATRLALDSAAELEQSLTIENRAGALVMLTELLRARGVTTLAIRAVRQRVGPELEFADSPLEVLAENVVLLRSAHLGSRARERASTLDGELGHFLSILKMRDSAYQPDTRAYVLGAGGLRVFLPGESMRPMAGPSSARITRGTHDVAQDLDE